MILSILYLLLSRNETRVLCVPWLTPEACTRVEWDASKTRALLLAMNPNGLNLCWRPLLVWPLSSPLLFPLGSSARWRQFATKGRLSCWLDFQRLWLLLWPLVPPTADPVNLLHFCHCFQSGRKIISRQVFGDWHRVGQHDRHVFVEVRFESEPRSVWEIRGDVPWENRTIWMQFLSVFFVWFAELPAPRSFQDQLSPVYNSGTAAFTTALWVFAITSGPFSVLRFGYFFWSGGHS